MTTETINALALSLVRISGYNNGGPRRYETFRVSWSVDGTAVDLRTRKGRDLSSRSLCDATNCQGASERDRITARMRRECAEALARLAESQTGLAGLAQL